MAHEQLDLHVLFPMSCLCRSQTPARPPQWFASSGARCSQECLNTGSARNVGCQQSRLLVAPSLHPEGALKHDIVLSDHSRNVRSSICLHSLKRRLGQCWCFLQAIDALQMGCGEPWHMQEYSIQGLNHLQVCMRDTYGQRDQHLHPHDADKKLCVLHRGQNGPMRPNGSKLLTILHS